MVIGGGFTGLGAAYELSRRGVPVTVLEADEGIGGLAGSFTTNGQPLEKFYHHWFTSDTEVMRIIDELDQRDRIVFRQTPTGMYYANSLFKLSSPLDLLRFSPLAFPDRIRLGAMVFKVRRYKDWRELDAIPASRWLIDLAGPEVFRVVWEPLLRGKFGEFADQVSAAWFWSKMVIRGGSRGRGGAEKLAYFKGGFAALADGIANSITKLGGVIQLNSPVTGLKVEDGRVHAVETEGRLVQCDGVIATPGLPVIADILSPYVSSDYEKGLRAIRYLANVCLVLELDRSLSDLYWINVNDPGFPFIGVIEHTNFEPPNSYGGRHIVYLSKYLSENADLYRMSDEAFLEFSLPHVRRMFPDFDSEWVKGYSVWRAPHAQPVVECGYGHKIPAVETPLSNFFIATMAQVFPEDRGTNYALRDGRRVGRRVAEYLAG